MAEQVIIEFISDTSGLDSSNQKLEQQGKITHQNGEEFKKTNAEMIKQQKALEQIGAVTKKIDESGKITRKNLADLAKIIKSQSADFQKEIKKGVIDALEQAGISAKEFEKAMDGAIGPTVKQKLRALLEEMAKLKAEGKDNTEQYKAMAVEAGHLKDVISDAAQEVRNLASDTSSLDGLIGVAQGVAGSFAVMQGAAALFGDESEELQKTLLRVNAAMAILQGLQQIQITLQKESAAATFADTIVTKARTAAQVLFNFVVGTSTGLLKALRIALAATGVGLLVIGVLALVEALKASNDQLEKANNLIDLQKSKLENFNDFNDKRTALEIERAKSRKALESELIQIQGRGLVSQRAYIVALNKGLSEQRAEVSTTSEAWFKLNEQIEANSETIRGIDNDILKTQLQLERQIVEERLRNISAGFATQLAAAQKNSKEELEIKKMLVRAERDVALNAEGLTANERLKIIAEANKKIRDLNLEFQKTLQEDRISALETSLLLEQRKARQIGERITQKEIDIQKQLIQEKADLELLQEGLTQNQILEIKTKSLNDQLKLQRDFNKQASKEALQDIVSRNNAQLDQLQIGDDKALALTIENIIAAAKIEEEENKGNADKIKEINAKRDKDIRDARIASIQATLDYEIQITQARSGELLRSIDKELQAQERIRNASSETERKRIEKQTGFKRISLEQEIKLIDLNTSYEAGAIQKRIDALNKQRADKLISEKDYNLQYEILVDEQTQAVEKGEQRKKDAINSTTESAKKQIQQIVETSVQAASEIVNLLDSLFQLQSSKENDSIQRQKQELKDLQDAGAITEKEAVIRQKRLEAEEKRIRQQQAQRDKQIAVFKALLAIPQAVLQGLSQGGPILAAIYGALAAAQAAIVIARPIPKFGKGKKDGYEGPGIVGEVGAELIQKNGRMYVADKPELIWLGKSDKVFNPKETEKMLSKTAMNSERPSLKIDKKPFTIDYKKLGKEVGKNIPQTGINIDENGFREWVSKGNSFETWLNNRRSRS